MLCSCSAAQVCSQLPSLRFGALLQHPVVDLERQAAAPPASVKPHGAAAPALPTPPPAPFAGEHGLVEATLVCLSTGSSGERQHAFAQQLIKQLAALADVALAEPGSAAAHVAGGYAGGGYSGAGASPAAVQVSAWLRLALLLPLLPLVYKHRSADAGAGLRGQLLRALLRLLASPAVRTDAAAALAGSDGTDSGRAAATAAAAAAAAGEALPQRLLHLLRALLVGGWASWMRLEGESSKATRERQWACSAHTVRKRSMIGLACLRCRPPQPCSLSCPCRGQAARRPCLRAQPTAGSRGLRASAAAPPAGGCRGSAAASPAAGPGDGSDLPEWCTKCRGCLRGCPHGPAAQRRRQQRWQPAQPRPLAASGGRHRCWYYG